MSPASKQQQRLKVLIAFGLVAPSAARLFFPSVLEVQSLGNMLSVIAGLIWLFEF